MIPRMDAQVETIVVMENTAIVVTRWGLLIMIRDLIANHKSGHDSLGLLLHLSAQYEGGIYPVQVGGVQLQTLSYLLPPHTNL